MFRITASPRATASIASQPTNGPSGAPRKVGASWPRTVRIVGDGGFELLRDAGLRHLDIT